MGMYVSNNKVLTKLPDLISTIGDLPEEIKTIITPYGNKYKVFNLGYQYSNPLILPLDITLDAIVYGNITLSSTVVKSQTFQVVTEYGSKFSITGEGTVLLWYRYGKLDPATFNSVMDYALEQNDYILIDALLHSLSIDEAVSFILQNPAVQEQFKKGLDWQFNKLGFTDFLAYINNGKYDVRKVALFLTIASYVFPFVFSYTNIPQFSGNPLQVFVQYLEYLNEFGQTITSEISELFSDVYYLSEQIDQEQLEISVLFAENSILSSEIDQLEEQINYVQSELEEQIDYLYSLIKTLISPPPPPHHPPHPPQPQCPPQPPQNQPPPHHPHHPPHPPQPQCPPQNQPPQPPQPPENQPPQPSQPPQNQPPQSQNQPPQPPQNRPPQNRPPQNRPPQQSQNQRNQQDQHQNQQNQNQQ